MKCLLMEALLRERKRERKRKNEIDREINRERERVQVSERYFFKTTEIWIKKTMYIKTFAQILWNLEDNDSMHTCTL